MANQRDLHRIKQGVKFWNTWRKRDQQRHPDLSGARLKKVNLSNADLSGADLSGAILSEAVLSGADLIEADLKGANLSGANLRGTDLSRANLSEAILSGADLTGAHLRGTTLTYAYLSKTTLKYADLSGADLSESDLVGADFNRPILKRANLSRTNLAGRNLRGINLSGANLVGINLSEAILEAADLSEANLTRANLSRANFSGANLSRANLEETSGADLTRVIFIGTNLENTLLTNCLIYGISAWDVQMEGAIQFDLVITLPDQPTITVDNLKVAQFIHLLLNNKEIRDVIDTITSKVVLILGRFTTERKAILDALKDELRKHNYLPVLFDFEKPTSQDLTGTVTTLAHLARFIIVDLTDPSSAPHEVATIIPHTVVPVQPLLSREPFLVNGEVVERREYAMFEDLDVGITGSCQRFATRIPLIFSLHSKHRSLRQQNKKPGN